MMETIRLKTEFIKLGQALKLSGLCETGSEAKEVIQDGLVLVNQETELRRGRKLYKGDILTYNGVSVQIEE